MAEIEGDAMACTCKPGDKLECDFCFAEGERIDAELETEEQERQDAEDRRQTALYRHARFVYEYDRD